MARLALKLSPIIVLVAAIAALPQARSADASYHIAYISEVMSGYDGNPDAQFIEVRMDFPAQNRVEHTRLTVFSADGSEWQVLLLLPHDLPNDGVNVRFIMATQAFVDETGLEADFIFPPGLPAPGGMICWGGPGFGEPDAQPPEFPFFYTDCVAYGGYSGGDSSHPPPSELPPGDGFKSLTRLQPTAPGEDTGAVGEERGEAAHLSAPPDSFSFDLRCASPENNAGVRLLLGPDADGDGLPDCHEGELATDPNDSDSDGDGFSDRTEYDARSDPNDPDSVPSDTPTPTPELVIVGDLDRNELVNSLDALLLLQHVAGLTPAPDMRAADVNCSGRIDAIDAALVLQYGVGFRPPAPPGCRAIGTPA